MICLQIATWLISLYILAESFLALCRMPGGFVHFCAKVKYLLAFTSAMVFLYYNAATADSAVIWLIFGSAGTLAWFVWPRTVWRVRQYLKELDEWESRNDI